MEGRPRVNKRVLRGMLVKTEMFNRYKEENEMWKQHLQADEKLKEERKPKCRVKSEFGGSVKVEKFEGCKLKKVKREKKSSGDRSKFVKKKRKRSRSREREWNKSKVTSTAATMNIKAKDRGATDKLIEKFVNQNNSLDRWDHSGFVEQHATVSGEFDESKLNKKPKKIKRSRPSERKSKKSKMI